METPGDAVAVDVSNGLAAVAQLEEGVSIIDVSSVLYPGILAHLDTDGSARDVAISGDYVAVADGSNGLVVIDISDPASASVSSQLSVPGDATTVEAGNGVAYVGTTGGRLVVADLSTGALLDQLTFDEAVEDVGVTRDLVGVLTSSRLYLIAPFELGLFPLGDVSAKGGAPPQASGRTLFMGSDHAYAGTTNGYTVFGLVPPSCPMVLSRAQEGQPDFYDLAEDGSGLVVAISGEGSLFDAGVSIYDGSDPGDSTSLLSEFDTDGTPRSLSIYNGLAYIAAEDAGLLVYRYKDFDVSGAAPEIQLDASFSLSPARVEEGKRVRVTAVVSDDVQVRNVQFYLDGERVLTDGSFPFEFRFVSPLLSEQSSLTLQARASDTGGNAAWTDEITVEIVGDVVPPRVLFTDPPDGGTWAAGIRLPVSATFYEPLDPATLTEETFVLVTDGGAGSPLTTRTLTYLPETNTAILEFPPGIAEVGTYQAELRPPLADLAGNELTEPITWMISVQEAVDVSFVDTSGGVWNEPANWDPVLVPKHLNRALFNSSLLGSEFIDLDVDAKVAGLTLGGGGASPFLTGDGVKLTLLGPSQVQNGATLTLDDGGLLGPGPITALDGRISLTNCDVASRIDMTDGSLTVIGSTVFERRVRIESSGSLTIQSSSAYPNVVIDFAGGLSFDGSLSIGNSNGQTIEFRPPSGALTVSDGNSMIVNGGSGSSQSVLIEAEITNEDNVTLQNNTTLTAPNPTHVNRGGFSFGGSLVTIELGDSGVFSNQGDFSSTGSSDPHVLIDGGTFINETDGTIRGSGTIELTGDPLLNEGLIRASQETSSLGFLTIDGDLEQTSTGTVRVNFNSFTGEVDNVARLVVTGHADLGGTFLLDPTITVAPPIGTEIELITFASRTGEFDVLDIGPFTAGGIDLEVYYTDTAVGVEIVAE